MITCCDHAEGNSFTEVSLMSFSIGKDGEFIRSIARKMCCQNCVDKYSEIGVLLRSREEESLWISGISVCPIVLNKTVA